MARQVLASRLGSPDIPCPDAAVFSAGDDGPESGLRELYDADAALVPLERWPIGALLPVS